MDPDPTKHQDLNFNENLKISGQSDRDPVNLDPNPKNVRLSNNNTLTFHALHFFFVKVPYGKDAAFRLGKPQKKSFFIMARPLREGEG